MAEVTDLLSVKTELFSRKTTRERMRKIALQLCDRLEIAEGAALVASSTNKSKT